MRTLKRLTSYEKTLRRVRKVEFTTSSHTCMLKLQTANTHTYYTMYNYSRECLPLLRLIKNPPVCWSKVVFAAIAWPVHSTDKAVASVPACWPSSVFPVSGGQENHTKWSWFESECMQKCNYKCKHIFYIFLNTRMYVYYYYYPKWLPMQCSFCRDKAWTSSSKTQICYILHLITMLCLYLCSI